MVTENVDKGSLFDLLHSGETQQRLPRDTIMKVAKQIANALYYLRMQGYTHCDLQSKHILLTKDLTVKLTGFSYVQHDSEGPAKFDVEAERACWMAPEVLRGQDYLPASDMYSFGVLLWEMLTGQIPY